MVRARRACTSVVKCGTRIHRASVPGSSVVPRHVAGAYPHSPPPHPRRRCGHCKSLAPEFAAAAEDAEGSGVKFGALDATQHAATASKYGVKGYPTLITFPGGGREKNSKGHAPYEGPRTASALSQAANALGGPRKAQVAQVTGPAAWDTACAEKKICVLVVLPHILDDGAAKRTAHIDVVAEAARGVTNRRLYGFTWSEVGAQPALEAALNTGIAPALYAVSWRSRGRGGGGGAASEAT